MRVVFERSSIRGLEENSRLIAVALWYTYASAIPYRQITWLTNNSWLWKDCFSVSLQSILQATANRSRSSIIENLKEHCKSITD